MLSRGDQRVRVVRREFRSAGRAQQRAQHPAGTLNRRPHSFRAPSHSAGVASQTSRPASLAGNDSRSTSAGVISFSSTSLLAASLLIRPRSFS